MGDSQDILGINKDANTVQFILSIAILRDNPSNPWMFIRLRNSLVILELLLIEFSTFLTNRGALDCYNININLFYF